MSELAASVIIVSHKRPQDMERAMASLAYQTVRNIEIIVVADRPPLRSNLLDVPVRYVEFEGANISRARNLGLVESNAPLVAFCDDDAVPDPFWLERLIAPFYAEKNVGATGGFVRGRNGISYQWKGIGFMQNAVDFPIDVDEKAPWTLFPPRSDWFVKTVGTNCAFRKSMLFRIGGYDEGFHYYLDDTDVNIRLQQAGYATAIVPDAQMIHNFARSRGRKDNRVPQSLYNIGASTNLYLRKHCPDELLENLENFYEAQDQRLMRYFHLGLMTTKKVRLLMRDLNNGLISGSTRQSLTPLKPKKNARLVEPETRNLPMKIYDKSPPEGENMHEYPIYVKRLYSNHAGRFGFHRGGYWRFVGGRFGRIERKGAFWRYRTPNAYRRAVEKAIVPYFSPKS